MKWFKHDADAHMDAKIQKLKMRYGLEGYGLYWHCIELIAGKVSKDNITFELEHDAEVIAYQVGLHEDRVTEIMKYMINIGLFENSNGIVTCLKLSKRLDQSMTSSPEMRSIITQIKNKSHDPNMTESLKVMQEQNRIDKNRTDSVRELFNHWCEVMGKDSARLTDSRRSKIQARLNDGYSVDEIKLAITNCSRSDFHMGKNERDREFNEIDLICRNGEKLESFRDMRKQQESIGVEL